MSDRRFLGSTSRLKFPRPPTPGGLLNRTNVFGRRWGWIRCDLMYIHLLFSDLRPLQLFRIYWMELYSPIETHHQMTIKNRWLNNDIKGL